MDKITFINNLQSYFLTANNERSVEWENNPFLEKEKVEEEKRFFEDVINGLALIREEFEARNTIYTAKPGGKEGFKYLRFSVKDYELEMRRELKARRKVYQKIQGFQENFVDMNQQRQYDVLKELFEIFDTVSPKSILKIQHEYESIKSIVQTSMFGQ